VSGVERVADRDGVEPNPLGVLRDEVLAELQRRAVVRDEEPSDQRDARRAGGDREVGPPLAGARGRRSGARPRYACSVDQGALAKNSGKKTGASGK
jgi:hypothetical protein